VVAAQFDPSVSDGSEDLQLGLRTTYPDGSPAPDASGRVNLAFDSPTGVAPAMDAVSFRSDAKGTARLTVKSPSGGGRLRAVAVLEAIGDKKFARPFTAKEAVAIIAANEGRAVAANAELELHADRTILAPGERARILAMLPVGWGVNDSGLLWETIAGSDVFATNSIDFTGRSRWFEVEAKPAYGTGFYQTITLPVGGGKYQEQTVGFRIVPLQKRLSIRIAPESELAEPLKPFRVDFDVRDADDKPAADTELSVNIVDRAVYAVQPEFRPGVLDYFYPLPRLSLGTFYSDELQGYGYAAELMRPNFRLAALKSNVQPLKRDMRDTAGWFPHVITDANGHASVTAQMPANITEWLVTAIAIDRGGRAGEQKTMFRSARDLDIEPRLPPFLRDGDVVDGHVELLNHKPEPATLDLQLSASDGASLDGQTQWSQLQLAANGASLLPARMTTSGASGNAVLALMPASATSRTGGPAAIEIALRPASLEQVLPAARQAGGLAFAVPAEAERGSLEVSVFSGLLGAALSASSQLVQYPFGCTEQLSHTTLPNLMLMSLLSQTKLDAGLLAPLHLASSSERARNNAKLGIQRLLANQKSDGGFGAWPGDEKASFDMTLIAARVLYVARELEIEGSATAFQRAYAWLAGSVGPNESMLGLTELQLLHEIGVTRPITEASMALVKRSLTAENPSTRELVAALEIVGLRRQFDYAFPSDLNKASGMTVEAAATSLAQRLQQRRLTEVNWRPDCAALADAGFCTGEPALLASMYAALDANQALPGDLRQSLRQRLFELLRGGWWGSTFDTAEVLYRLRPVLANEASAARANGVRVARVPAAGLSIDLGPFPGGFVGRIDVARSRDLARVEIDGLADDDFATGIVRAQVRFPAVVRAANGLSVRRTLLMPQRGGVVPLEAGTPLPIGTVVVSQVVVERASDMSRWMGGDFSPSNLVVVEDGVPSIAEAIDDDRPYLADAGIQRDDDSYWAQVRETQRRPDRTVRVVNLGPGATFTTYQIWRVGFGGTASLPPPRAYDMYEDAIAGNDVAASITAR
jgi:uncharacterized protein YfaS (alpha-2-macroglobulin family)